jgi:hypothetical protein
MRARAESIRRQLVAHGVPAQRLKLVDGNVQEFAAGDQLRLIGRVRVTFEPREQLREDLDPSSEEYRKYCGAH